MIASDIAARIPVMVHCSSTDNEILIEKLIGIWLIDEKIEQLKAGGHVSPVMAESYEDIKRTLDQIRFPLTTRSETKAPDVKFCDL